MPRPDNLPSFIEYYENDEGIPYYYNQKTEETTWELPPELLKEATLSPKLSKSPLSSSPSSSQIIGSPKDKVRDSEKKDKGIKKDKKEKYPKKSGSSFFSNFFSRKEEILEISGPTNFKQLNHVGWNAEKGEFEGLPPEFKKQLEANGISLDEQAANPEQVLKVLKFQNNLQTGGIPRKITTISNQNLPPVPSVPLAQAPTPPIQSPKPTHASLPPAPNPRIDEGKPALKVTLKPKQTKPVTIPENRRLSAKVTGTNQPSAEPSLKPLKPKMTGKPLKPKVGKVGKPTGKLVGKPTGKLVKPTMKPNLKASQEGTVTQPEKPAPVQPQKPAPVPEKAAATPEKAAPTKAAPTPEKVSAPPEKSAPVAPPLKPIVKPPPIPQSGNSPMRPPPKADPAPAPEDNLPNLKDLVSNENPEILFSGEKLIGQGASGSVYTATDDRSGVIVALKKMVIAQQVKRDVLINEILTMKGANHPNIVNFIDSYIVEGSLWVAMEYVNGASLTEVIEANKAENPLKETHIAYITRETLKGLEYLHSKEIIHRDIKSDNILCSLSGQIKITDFGYSAQLNAEAQKRSSQVGTTYWMSPEVINAESDYDTKTDIWSTGVMIYEMVEGDPPYIDKPVLKALLLITTDGLPQWSKPDKMSQNLKDMVHQMCEFDPHVRPTATTLLTHGFLKDSCNPDALGPYIQHAKDEAEKNLNMEQQEVWW